MECYKFTCQDCGYKHMQFSVKRPKKCHRCTSDGYDLGSPTEASECKHCHKLRPLNKMITSDLCNRCFGKSDT